MDFVNLGGWWNIIENDEVKVTELACFGHISIIVIVKINLERSERKKKRKVIVLGIQIKGPRPLGGRAPGAPPWIRL